MILQYSYHSFLDLFLLLLREAVRYAGLAGLRGQQQLPQLAHEQPRVLPVQEPCQVDLHLLRTRELGRGRDRERKHHIIINLSRYPFNRPISV